MKNIICFILYNTGILGIFDLFYKKYFRKGSLTVFMYHSVGISGSGGKYISVSPENFEKQIRYLSRNYKIISLEALCRFISLKEALLEDYLVITIDDGYKDNYVNAYPVLKRYNIPATIFLTSGYIGTNRILWWDRIAGIINIIKEQKIDLRLQEDIYPEEIKSILIRIFCKEIKRVQEAVDLLCIYLKNVSEKEKNIILNDLEKKLQPYMNGANSNNEMLSWEEVIEMSENGIDFGGHTVTHPILTKIGIAQAKDEILNSKKEVESRIKRKILHFSYPNGKEGDFNEEIKNIVKESGYLSSCSAIEGVNDLQSDLFALKRKGVNNSPFYVFAFRHSVFFNFIRSKMGK